MSHRKTPTSSHKAFAASWFVAAQSKEIGIKPLQRFFLGKPYVLFRGDQNNIACLEDACLHRGTPLSWGCVKDGEIECPYHKWIFSRSGACTFIPEHEGDLPTRKIPSFSTFERGGLVFVSFDDEETLPDFLPEGLDYRFETLPLKLSVVVQLLINGLIQKDVNKKALKPYLTDKKLWIGEGANKILISHKGYRIEADGKSYFLTPAEKNETYMFCPQKRATSRRSWLRSQNTAADEGCQFNIDMQVDLPGDIKKAAQEYLQS